jgi:hypothetical protein
MREAGVRADGELHDAVTTRFVPCMGISMSELDEVALAVSVHKHSPSGSQAPRRLNCPTENITGIARRRAAQVDR